MKIKKIIVLIILTVLIFISCSCTQNKNNGKIKITASFYPVYIAAMNVLDGIENIELKILAQPTVGCLHDYQLTPDEMITLMESDILLVNGGGMEAFIDKVISNKSLKIVYASKGINWLKDKHNHGEDEINAHAWLDVGNYTIYVNNILDSVEPLLNDEDSKKARNNAQAYIKKLTALDNELKSKLKNVKEKNIVTFHEAFDYFASAYGLNVAAVIESEPGISPTPDMLIEIIKTINSLDNKVIFTEPQYSKTAADSIKEQTSAEMYTLDPIVTGELDKDAYIKIMKQNLETLMVALG